MEKEIEKKLPDVQTLDLTEQKNILLRVGNNWNLLNKVVQKFDQSTPIQLAEIHQAIQLGDAQSLEETAHKLKGAIGNFSIKSAFQKASDLEKMGKEKRFADACKTVAQLAIELEKLKNNLKLFITSHTKTF